MKYLVTSLLLCLLCVGNVSGQKVSTSEYGGMINLMETKGKPGGRILVLRSQGYGKKEGIAKDDAVSRAVRAVLFIGFGKNLPKVISTSEAEANVKSNGKLDAFFSNREYLDCVVDVRVKSDLKKLKGEKEKSQMYEVSVNYDAVKLKVREMSLEKFGF